MCQDHPFHSLYQVFCLKPSDQPATRHSGRFRVTQSDRETAAIEIFDRLRNDPNISERVRDVERLSNICVGWANFPLKHNAVYRNKGRHTVPSGSPLLALRNLKVPVLTYHTPLDHTTKYDQCIWIQKYNNVFETVGGKSVPKANECFGSDGLRYKQLVSFLLIP